MDPNTKTVDAQRHQQTVRALQNLRAGISDFKGHGMPGFTDRANAIFQLEETDRVLAVENELAKDIPRKQTLDLTPDQAGGLLTLLNGELRHNTGTSAHPLHELFVQLSGRNHERYEKCYPERCEQI